MANEMWKMPPFNSNPNSVLWPPNERPSWLSTRPGGGLMEFQGSGTTTTGLPLHAKRKPTMPVDPAPVPPKKMLTEDSMAAHLSKMHISGSCQDADMESSPDSVNEYMINMSQWDLERKLRTAQKITICDELLDIGKDQSPLLPEILLNRMTKPCNALILWQPPPTLDELLHVHDKSDESKASEKADVEEQVLDEEQMET